MLSADQRRRLFGMAREIRGNRERIAAEWTTRFRLADAVQPPDPDGPDEAAHLVGTGGFRVPGRLDGSARQLADGVVENGWRYLRGPGYYSADPHMYLAGRVPSAAARFALLQERWQDHARRASSLARAATPTPTPWYAWIAWISFLEAVLNDLCTARWSASAVPGLAAGRNGGGEVVAVVDDGIRRIAGLIAEAAWHHWQHTGSPPETWLAKAEDVLHCPALRDGFDVIAGELSGAGVEPWMVRAVREGDVLWQVAAAFHDRWPAIVAKHPTERILLVSEAFGALAAGPLWRAMVAPGDRDRVEFATSRTSVHEAEMNRVPSQGWAPDRISAQDRVVVHLDDSIFTGRTHELFRDRLDGQPVAVYLVTMSFDVGTPFNHPEEILASGRTITEHLDVVESVVREPGGMLPAATSFWARRKQVPPAGDTDSAAFARVIGGSDLLMAALWQRYAATIRG